MAQAQLLPLRKDNARLVREANELHREAIAVAESQGTGARAATVDSAKLTSAAAEAQFLRAQVEKELAAQTEACGALREQLQVWPTSKRKKHAHV